MRVLAASFTRIFAVVLFVLGTDAAAITFDGCLVHIIDAGRPGAFVPIWALRLIRGISVEFGSACGAGPKPRASGLSSFTRRAIPGRQWRLSLGRTYAGSQINSGTQIPPLRYAFIHMY